MRKLHILLLAGGSLIAASFALAQSSAVADSLVERMMAYDKNGDGKLTKSEVGDERLSRLFDRADADKDGTVTRAELSALATKEAASYRGNSGGFGPPGGSGPPGGFGGPGGPMMGPPRPGEVLPPFFRRALELTADQQAELDALQKEVDARLARILTEPQKKTLEQMRRRGPGGPRGRGGFGPPPPPGDEAP